MPRDCQTLNADDFEGYVGEAFTLSLDEGVTLPLTLSAVERHPPLELPPALEQTVRKHPFTLVFEGPPEGRLTQGEFKVANERFGEVALFIVPVVSGPGKRVYEAVFG